MDDQISADLKPLLLDGAVLYHPDGEDGFTTGPILVLADLLGRKYSFATKIRSIEQSKDGKTVLYVDKKKVGQLSEGDEVTIISFNVPKADSITLILPEHTRVPGGDWDTLLQDQFDGQIVDEGEEFNFTYPSANPILLSSIVKSSIPLAPVQLTPKTRVSVTKLDETRKSEVIYQADRFKADRVDDYRELLDDQLFRIVNAIKADRSNSASRSFDFESDPEGILQGIRSIFGSWKLYKPTKHRQGDIFTAGSQYILQDETGPYCLCEISIFANKDNGHISVDVHTISDTEPKALLNELVTKIHSMARTTSTTFRIMNARCPGCGNQFQLEELSGKEWIKCIECGEYVQVPLKYSQ